MTIRITKWNGLCLAAEKKYNWCLRVWWLGKWWGRCGFSSHGRHFYRADVTYYHHGWTRIRRTWLVTIMIEFEKSLTWQEKMLTENVERMHHYQLGRAAIMGLRFKLRKVIVSERLVGVVMARLVVLRYF